MVLLGKYKQFGYLPRAVALACVLLLVTVGCALEGSNSSDSETPATPLENLSTLGADSTADKEVARGKSRKPTCLPGAEVISASEPIEVRFFDDGSFSVNGPIVKWEWNFSGPEHPPKPKHRAWVDYSDSLGEAFHTYNKRGTKVAHLRVTDSSGRTAVSKIKLKAPTGDPSDPGDPGDPEENVPPVAVATVNPSAGISPLIVELSAEGSYDPDGEISTYEWDPGDGSGYLDASATFGELNWGYNSEGTFHPTLRVTDNLGAQSTASQTLIILPLPITNWGTRLIDTQSSTGSWSSLNIVGGNPGVSYYDGVNGDLKYSHATVPIPSEASHWEHHTVDAEGLVGSFQTALAEVGGKPAIAYYNNTRAILQYARALTTFPGSPGDWAIHVVDETSSVGLHSSIVIFNGKPAIAYQDNQHNDIRLAYANVPEPEESEDWSISVVESEGDLGLDGICLLEIAGSLVVTYQNHSKSSLRFAKALTVNPAGNNDWAIHDVDTGVNLGKWSSLAVLNGNPAVSYFDSFNSNLKFARALIPDPQSSSDWQVTVVDDSQHVGNFGTSLTVFNQRPIIAYRDDVRSILLVAEALVTLPNTISDWSILPLDPTPSSGYYPSIATVGGVPAITYNRAGFLAYGNAVP